MIDQSYRALMSQLPHLQLTSHLEIMDETVLCKLNQIDVVVGHEEVWRHQSINQSVE